MVKEKKKGQKQKRKHIQSGFKCFLIIVGCAVVIIVITVFFLIKKRCHALTYLSYFNDNCLGFVFAFYVLFFLFSVFDTI